jgi:hypothetical protein
MMAISPFGGFILLLAALAGIVVGIIMSRISAELILIVFRINENLGAIRDQGRDRGCNFPVIPAKAGIQPLNANTKFRRVVLLKLWL